jgi:hypothetical protein
MCALCAYSHSEPAPQRERNVTAVALSTKILNAHQNNHVKSPINISTRLPFLALIIDHQLQHFILERQETPFWLFISYWDAAHEQNFI